MSESEREPWEGWAILEIMGHRRLAGLVSRVEVAGFGMLRLDVPGCDEGTGATQYYSPSSLYCLTPTTEEVARGFATRNRPTPVARFELDQPTPRDVGWSRSHYPDGDDEGFRYEDDGDEDKEDKDDDE